MGLAVNQKAAKAILDEAAAWALSERPVPVEWVNWTHEVDASPSKTFTVALGTALLAKATNPNIDALALKATSGPQAYSARTIAHNVLVPGAAEHGYDLRATGREPLNNQPFFRYDRIDEIDRIHTNAKPFLPTLIGACWAINELDTSQALAGLAAFLRIRIGAVRERVVVTHSTGMSLQTLIAETEKFVHGNPEGGRRGQAVVAAIFDLVFPNVRSSRVNDPSRRFPGDVQIVDGEAVFAIEVRQKVVSYPEALQFAARLQDANVMAGLIVMLSPGQPEIDAFKLLENAEKRYGIVLGIAYSVHSLFMSAITWSGKPVSTVQAGFPGRMLARLEEIDSSRSGIKEWTRIFATRDRSSLR
jgi:hypothetical protein